MIAQQRFKRGGSGAAPARLRDSRTQFHEMRIKLDCNSTTEHKLPYDRPVHPI